MTKKRSGAPMCPDLRQLCKVITQPACRCDVGHGHRGFHRDARHDPCHHALRALREVNVSHPVR